MDRNRAHEAFIAYVSAYDPTNPRIALKVDHTLRVAALCERIASSTSDDDAFVELAWLAGLLHDIGRFEQVRRYDTFNDGASVPHAALGAEILFSTSGASTGEPLIRAFAEPELDEALRTAVATHSDYRLPDQLDPRTRMLCQVLRDADKIDILKVNCICPIEDIYGVTERDMRDSQLTPACVETFYERRCLPRGIRRHPADIMLGHICFAWELVYEESRRIVVEQGHLRTMLSRSWTLPETQASFQEMREYMGRELGLGA